MIQDVDTALEALVRRDALNGSRVEVLFDAPTKDWVARRNAPTVDLYLYDIREELSRREIAWADVRDESGRVVERRPPPRRFRLSYLVTAWTQRPEDEHRLLSSMLTAFLSTEVVPADLLGGVLKDSPVAVVLRVALPPTEDRSIADVWTALGGELKPSIDLQVIAPVAVGRKSVAAPPVLEAPELSVRSAAGASEQRGGGSDRSAAERRPSHLSADEAANQDETVRRGRRGTLTGGGPRAAADDKAGTAPGTRIRLRGISRP